MNLSDHLIKLFSLDLGIVVPFFYSSSTMTSPSQIHLQLDHDHGVLPSPSVAGVGAQHRRTLCICDDHEDFTHPFLRAREIAWRCEEAVRCLEETDLKVSPMHIKRFENGLLLEYVSNDFCLA